MPLIAAALAATLSVSATCSWNRPGVDPYRGDAATALAHYPDIPAAQRKVLLDKMSNGQPDDRVAIRRDAIVGDADYDPAIRDMHFGKAKMCGSVDRSKWRATRSEPAPSTAPTSTVSSCRKSAATSAVSRARATRRHAGSAAGGGGRARAGRALEPGTPPARLVDGHGTGLVRWPRP